jgi:hypothetical protein
MSLLQNQDGPFIPVFIRPFHMRQKEVRNANQTGHPDHNGRSRARYCQQGVMGIGGDIVL